MNEEQLKGKRIKVSWWMARRDGSKTQMHVAGECLSIKDNVFMLQGELGEIFSIPVDQLIAVRIKE